MNRIVHVVSIISLILSSIGVLAVPDNIRLNDADHLGTGDAVLLNRDELDQHQETQHGGMLDVGYFAGYTSVNSSWSQSFKPTKNILTKVELYIAKYWSGMTYPYFLAIRQSLTGQDLIRLAINPNDISTSLSWVEFNFDDIAVTPGQLYYLISYSSNVMDNTHYWGANDNSNSYPNGSLYSSIDGGLNWETWLGDACFRTYGRINLPPDKPSITGETKGKPGLEYYYKFVSSDPDGINVSYYIDWGDNSNSGWLGSYQNGEPINISHTWTEKGTYIIKCKAKDNYGTESDEGTLKIKMPCSYNIPFLSFWERLFERFPNAFPILRFILTFNDF